jgi:LacI family sucrose operon transcriptional repressor
MTEKKVTFDDIARYTGFSKTTISRYFNNPDSITLKNQEIIANALKELNYKENKLAKVLANGNSEFIGLIIPNLYLHYYAEVLNQLLMTYEQYGYKFIVFSGNDSEDTERKYIQELLAYKIEGLIILSHTIPSAELASYDIPVVGIEREDLHINSVSTDNYMGATQATSLLIKNNCDILIHINSDMSHDVPAYKRVQAFTDMCEEKKCHYELIIDNLGNTYHDTYEAMLNIFNTLEKNYPNDKKGLFMANDTHANIMLNIIIRKYGTLPDTYRIVGFDGSPIAEDAIIPITTIGQQIDLIAREAMNILEREMSERKKRKPNLPDTLTHKIITPVLIRRETTD